MLFLDYNMSFVEDYKMKYRVCENKKENSLQLVCENKYTKAFIESWEFKGCKVIHTFEAESYNEAMQTYYDYMEWGTYTPF